MKGLPRLQSTTQGRAPAPVTAGRAREALDVLTAGQSGSYKALLVLHRAAASDPNVVFDATMDRDPNQRWKYLWAASGFLAKSMRAETGHQAVTTRLQKDLGLAHFFSLFVRRRNPAAKRLLQRARDSFLPFMLKQVAGATHHARKLALLVGIVEHLETREEPLRRAIAEALGPVQVDALLPHLVLREDPRHLGGGSRRLSQKLQGHLQALLQAKALQESDGGSHE